MEDEELVEETAKETAKLVGKKILKFGALALGFAAIAIGLAKVLASEDQYVEVFGEEEVAELAEQEKTTSNTNPATDSK